jgi:hypothetical protein
MQKPEEMHFDWRYSFGVYRNRKKVKHDMKLAAFLSFAMAMTAAASAWAAEQCRFIEARAEREACYQRQEVARAARQKAQEAQQTAQQKPYEPMAPEDAQLAKSMRGICRGC